MILAVNFEGIFCGLAKRGFRLLGGSDGRLHDGSVQLVILTGVSARGVAGVRSRQAFARRRGGIFFQQPPGINAGGLGDRKGEFFAERELPQFNGLNGAG